MTEQVTEYKCPICGQPLTIVMSAIHGYYATCKGLNGCGMRTGRYDYEFVKLENVLYESKYQKAQDEFDRMVRTIHEDYQKEIGQANRQINYNQQLINELRTSVKSADERLRWKEKQYLDIQDELSKLKAIKTDPGWYQCNDGIYTFITDDDDKMRRIIENYALMNRTIAGLEYLPNGVLNFVSKEMAEREEND